MARSGLLARAALAALLFGVLVTLGGAACTDGTTPDCSDGACGTLPDVGTLPDAGTLPDTGTDAGGETGAAE